MNDLDFAAWQARRIGELIRGTGPTSTVTKADGTPQTDIDVAGNEMFHAAVGEHRRDDLALGEEDVNEARTPPAGARVWVCDPVDGTWLLPYRLPYTVVSIALVQDGQPRVGVIYDPHADRTFAAAAGQGAYLDGAPLRVNDHSTLAGAVLALPGGSVPGLDVARLHSEAIGAGADLITVGSVAHDATLVPVGFAAAMVYPYTSPWDMAAAACLVTEAGGRITALDGTAQRYDDRIRGAVLSNGRLHNDLLDLIARCTA